MSSLTNRVLASAIVLVPVAALAAPWQGFVDKSDALRTDRFNFQGTQAEAGDTNENYYDGDFGDFDGDGRLDRGMISRYGLLWNTGDGTMVPVANTVGGSTYRFGDKDAIGNDAVIWADIDGDGDLDSIMGGNGEAFTCQTNQASRFSIKWQHGGSSAKRIIKIDLERDGDVDLVAAGTFCLTRNCGQPDDFTVWVNDGMGNVTDQTVARGLDYSTGLIAGVAAGDVDGDGDFDLVLMSGTRRRGLVLVNNGTGTFTERVFFTIPDAVWTYDMGGQPSVGMSGSDTMELGDIDGDGDLDLVVAAEGPIGTHPNVFHAIFINDGSGNFAEDSAARFSVGAFTGKLYAPEAKLADFDADGDLDLVAYAQTGQADLMGQNLQVFINDGSGHFTFTPGLTPGFTPPTGGINAFDVADYSGDGSVDLWVGNQGGRVLAFVNTYADPSGLPADMPRSAAVVSATSAGVRLSWLPPPSASQVRFYRIYRSTEPGLPIRDRELVKTVAISPFADEGFVAPITKFTTAAQLGDPSVSIDPASGQLQWTDATGGAGVPYYYSIVHVGNETKASTPTAELVASKPAAVGTDTTGPELTILGPTRQQWSLYPRISLQYGDGQSGINLASLRVSFSAAVGSRPAGTDVSDLSLVKDARAFVAPLVPPYSLPVNTLVTMTASIADNAGNTTMKTVQFFVAQQVTTPPVASFTATPGSGNAPIDIAFDARASADADGKVVQYEWYFGDGSAETGATPTHRYLFGGTYTATLVIRDTQGGTGVATKMITTTGAAPECTNGDTRACYTGPDGTSGVGVCVGGLQSCAAGAWDASCSAEIVPMTEICDDAIDNDCDGSVDADDPDCDEAGAGAKDGGCGCRSSGVAGLPLTLALIAFATRRRRGSKRG